MKSIALWAFLMMLVTIPVFGKTWYVRRDGGTRYSAKMPKGQCDGSADAPYPGKGTNQHCAFNDYRFLWDDQSFSPGAWVFAGGDTVIIRNGPWRVGFDQGANQNDVWCKGGNGPDACGSPVIPAGTPAHHTRILGENFANCNKSNMTQLYGGYGLGTVMWLSGAQYVDIQCLDITSHAQCTVHGEPAFPKRCRNSYPYDDFDAVGFTTNVETHDLFLQDLWIHGHTDRGIKGPIGGLVSAVRVDIAYNGMAGWDFDDGNGTPSVNGVWNFKESTIEWNGCNQEYPITHANPAVSCYSQSSGGYGDGVGTPARMCLTANIDHSSFHHNTQDGLDLGHADTGTCPMTITNSIAYANNGGTFKWGASETPAVLANNLVLSNCMRMSAPIEGTPSTYNQHLGDFCRAGDNISFNLRKGTSAAFYNNTIVGYEPTMFDVDCWDTVNCSTAKIIFRNNIVLGYDTPAVHNLGGKAGGPSGFYYQKPIGVTVRDNNIFYSIRTEKCPTGHTNERCVDPKFVNQPRFTKEQDLDNFNFHLSDGSPAIGTGARIPEVTTDYSGKPRPATGNYDLGALQH